MVAIETFFGQDIKIQEIRGDMDISLLKVLQTFSSQLKVNKYFRPFFQNLLNNFIYVNSKSGFEWVNNYSKNWFLKSLKKYK